MRYGYVVAALALATAGPAFAAVQDMPGGRPGPDRGLMGPHGPMPRPERMFDMIDANHDGVISRSEFMDAHRRMAERREMRRERRGTAEQPPRPR